MRGDLDWIVMKALAKDRQRRYDSAIGLANDIERFTNHEPVSAGPPTASYRFRKFVRRNRGRVVAASLVLVALVVGIIGTTLGLIEAQRRLAQKDKANEILLSIFRDLDTRARFREPAPPGSSGQRLDVATAELAGDATDDPIGVARMQIDLANAQLSLGYPERVIDLCTKARATFMAHLGPDHPDTLRSMRLLAAGYLESRSFERAVPLFEETLTLMKAKLGPDSEDTFRCMHGLALSLVRFDRLERRGVTLRGVAKPSEGPARPRPP